MSANYYVDTSDGEGDALICGSCVRKHGLQDDRPVDPEAFAIVPLACAIHAYGGNPSDYTKGASA